LLAGPLLAIDLKKPKRAPEGLAPEYNGPVYEEQLTQFHLESLTEQLKQVGACCAGAVQAGSGLCVCMYGLLRWQARSSAGGWLGGQRWLSVRCQLSN
jgi:hypothetical protein